MSTVVLIQREFADCRHPVVVLWLIS